MDETVDRRMRQVFLSYARDDSEWKALVQEAVARAGLQPWTDDRLVPGTPQWAGEIERAIQRSVALVVVLTPAAKGSDWVANEVAYAQHHDVPVIPVLAEGTATTSVPIGLIAAHHVDLRQPGAVSSLVRVLQRFAPSPVAPKRPSPVPATVRGSAPAPASVPAAARKPSPKKRSVARVLGAALLRLGVWLLARLRAARDRKPLPPPVPLAPAGPWPVVPGWGVADVVRGTRSGLVDLWAALQRSTSGAGARLRVRGGDRGRGGLLLARHVAFVIDAAIMLLVSAVAVAGVTMALAVSWGEYSDDCHESMSAPRCDAGAAVAGAGAWPWPGGIVVMAAGGQLLWRTTPGKAAMRLRVVGADGGAPSTRAVLVRTLFLPVDLFFGTLVSAVDEQGRRIGDVAAGTRVPPVAAAGWVGPVRPF